VPESVGVVLEELGPRFQRTFITMQAAPLASFLTTDWAHLGTAVHRVEEVGISMSKIGRFIVSSAASAVVVGTAMASLLAAPAQAAETAAPDPVAIASSDDGACKQKKNVGNGKNKGDIFHSYASTATYKHNHVGIYYTTKTIVEAPGKGARSKSVTASTLKKCGPIYKMYVNTKQSNRDKAANHAYNNFRDMPYDTNFADNKDNSNGKLNCSELVWKAYKHGAKIDLDSNGGSGVYPNNIKDHDSTVVYTTIK
jgi:uncharacterized protein YycO